MTMKILADMRDPQVTEWNYGAYRYGLEPLYLPNSKECVERGRFGALMPKPCDLDAVRLAEPPDLDLLDEVFWFRWITGHQITFVLWQLTARILGRPTMDQETAEVLTFLAEGYSAILLYTSSCTRDSYERVIRPSMYRQHHGFSGSWAPDYMLVRSLYNGRALASEPRDTTERLHRAVRVNQLVHAAVAARLVPGSESLLRTSISEIRLQPRSTLGVVYDQFFMTVREPVPDEEIISQLIRRLRAVLIDVWRNGLYPGGSESYEGLPPELRTPFISECEHRFDGIATGLALLAGGLAESKERQRVRNA
ncbi:hypothetical protein [Nocardia arthritidis]|uniref:L-tyrosine 3-hydroxylase n=1 Tax=Nocardia arthritidis TaxID=228602 RepID=A0A6G9Y9R9_9NOCA|nr:hypothetical protein [Nocardia arthritidis]QIS09870.1 hypothetical protein F5544_09850 [Nocardia arthritidis]